MKANIKQAYENLKEIKQLAYKQSKLHNCDLSLFEKIANCIDDINKIASIYGYEKFAAENNIFMFELEDTINDWLATLNKIKEAKMYKYADKITNGLKTKTPIKKLSPCEMYIYEMLTFEKFVLDKKSDHKHYHYYYTENRNGIGRWRKYEDIINYITLTIYKMVVEKPRTSPFDSKNYKKVPITIKYPKSVMQDFLNYAKNANLTLGDVIYSVAMNEIKRKVKNILGEWKKIA